MSLASVGATRQSVRLAPTPATATTVNRVLGHLPQPVRTGVPASVPKELDRPPGNTHSHERNAASPPARDTPAASVPPAANGARHGHSGNGNGNRRAATSSQVRALHAIATRQQFNLTELLRERFSLYRAEDLSITDASRLIDELNATHGSRA